MSTTRPPRTEAGRALVDELVNRAGVPHERLIREQVAAIEAEAAAPDAGLRYLRAALLDEHDHSASFIEEAFRDAAALAAHPEPAPDCRTCRHSYAEHTGRGLYEGRLRPESAKMGSGCEHRTDFHHTCSCAEYVPAPAPDRFTEEGCTCRRPGYVMYEHKDFCALTRPAPAGPAVPEKRKAEVIEESRREMWAGLGPAGPAVDPMPVHDIGCRCWPHVSEKDALAQIAAVGLAEYRAAGPAVDVDCCSYDRPHVGDAPLGIHWVRTGEPLPGGSDDEPTPERKLPASPEIEVGEPDIP